MDLIHSIKRFLQGHISAPRFIKTVIFLLLAWLIVTSVSGIVEAEAGNLWNSIPTSSKVRWGVALVIISIPFVVGIFVGKAIPSRKAELENFPTELDSDLEKAKHVWITGIHPYSFVTRHFSLLKRKIAEGHTLRVLVIDPNGEACKMSAMRFPGTTTSDDERARLTATLNQLCELKQKEPNNLEIRTIDYLLGYGVFLIDPDTNHGKAYVRQYSFRAPLKPGIILLKAIYQPGDARYGLIYKETQELWNSATPWKCQEQRTSTIRDTPQKRDENLPMTIFSGTSTGKFSHDPNGPWVPPVACNPTLKHKHRIDGATWVWIKEHPTDQEAKEGQVVWHRFNVIHNDPSEASKATLTLMVDDYVDIFINDEHVKRVTLPEGTVSLDIKPYLVPEINNVEMKIENKATPNIGWQGNPAGIIYRLEIR